MRQLLMQGGRYLIVQAAAYSIDYGGFLVLLWVFSVGVGTANIVAKLAAGLLAFFMHRNFTFGGRQFGRTRREAIRYFSLLTLNLPISTIVLLGIAWVLPVEIAKILSDILIVGVNFILARQFVFSNSATGGK